MRRFIPLQCPVHVHFSPDVGAEEVTAAEDSDGDDLAGSDMVMVGGSFLGACGGSSVLSEVVAAAWGDSLRDAVARDSGVVARVVVRNVVAGSVGSWVTVMIE